MNKRKITGREIAMIVILSVILIGTAYYLFFYFPYNAEMYSISRQTTEAETSIDNAMAKATAKKAMQDELEKILAMPKDQITEIAPYDNKEAVLNMLYGILAQTQDYSLSFQDPEVQKDGTVRRNIAMKFTCKDYPSAKKVIEDLNKSKWRCLVKNLNLVSETNMLEEPVSVSMQITFFESTNIEGAKGYTEPTDPPAPTHQYPTD